MMKVEFEKFVEILLFLGLLLGSFSFVRDVWNNYNSKDTRFFFIFCQILSVPSDMCSHISSNMQKFGKNWRKLLFSVKISSRKFKSINHPTISICFEPYLKNSSLTRLNTTLREFMLKSTFEYDSEYFENLPRSWHR